MKRKTTIRLSLLSTALLISFLSYSQMITGTWKGKINRQKVEVKIIQNGDSLTGTSYYYESAVNYRRYSIKGYFDANTNEAVWWDDHLLEETNHSASVPGKIPQLSRADFNCPGGARMMLDGKAGRPTDNELKGDVHLDKTNIPSFEDEWDYVLENYQIGANEPWIIDSVDAIAYQPPLPAIQEPIITQRPPVKEEKIIPQPKKEEPTTIEEKFTTRKKTFVMEVPLSGDSVELRFYDNAEIDGDSISLFLNDKLIFQHIRLLGSAYTIRLAVSDMKETNELIMVAENLGSIPPNTSFMVAEVGDKRYEAILASTEGSSAMIRFVKKKEE